MSDVVGFFGWTDPDSNIFVIQNDQGTDQYYVGHFYDTFGQECSIEYNQEGGMVKIKTNPYFLPNQLVDSAIQVCPGNWVVYRLCPSLCQI